jgi:hypothetical protein
MQVGRGVRRAPACDRVNASTPVSTNVERYDTWSFWVEKEHHPNSSWQKAEEESV